MPRSREEIARYYNVGCSRLACFQPISLSIASIHDHPSHPPSPPPPSPSSLPSPLPLFSFPTPFSLSLSLSACGRLFFGGSPPFFFSCPEDSEVRSPHIYCSTDLSTPMGARSTAAWPFIVVYKLARITRDHTYTYARGCPIQDHAW